MLWMAGFIVLLMKIGVALGALLLMAAYLVLLERKLLARFQIRYGPNRVGRFGLLQPLADGLKVLLKEDTIPAGADRSIFLFAPSLIMVVSLLLFAVVPFGADLTFMGQRVPLVVTDLNVGLLYVVALSSLSIYGIALGGWASNSKYSLLGAMRGGAQLISYELALSLSLVPVVLLARSLSLVDIVEAQARCPFILLQPVSFVLFFIGSMAESSRLPFDLPEAENELIAGYHTEYSGMRFALYFVGEYLTMLVVGALTAVFFLGGWRGPLLPPVVWFLLKMMVVPFLWIWTRATLPRLRYDQLMHLGWKILLPVSLLNIVVTAGVILLSGAWK
ncbi:MAG: NADH-quinone oxidoreductase subunit NuoH [Desulfobacteraceae bacterium]|nr:NADH-quinone oxidoreductase subunit NuoH [Desulfobacteraceae bacterium]